jgi:predicted RNase H-like HicB family nuclease
VTEELVAHKVVEKLRIGIRVVFYKESGFWVAHCLEMDVMGHGKEREKALENLSAAVLLQIENSVSANNHANIFMPADARFFEMYAAGKDTLDGECVLKNIESTKDDITLQGVEMREYHNPALAMA